MLALHTTDPSSIPSVSPMSPEPCLYWSLSAEPTVSPETLPSIAHSLPKNHESFIFSNVLLGLWIGKANLLGQKQNIFYISSRVVFLEAFTYLVLKTWLSIGYMWWNGEEEQVSEGEGGPQTPSEANILRGTEKPLSRKGTVEYSLALNRVEKNLKWLRSFNLGLRRWLWL